MSSSFEEFHNTVSKIITTKNTIYAFGRITKTAEEGGGECVCVSKQPSKIHEVPRPPAIEPKTPALEEDEEWEETIDDDDDDDSSDDDSSGSDGDSEVDGEGSGGGKSGANGGRRKVNKKFLQAKSFSKIRSFKKVVRRVVQTQSVIQTVENNVARNKVIVASKSKGLSKVTVTGGSPISEEIAIELRRRVFGSAELIGSSLGEWMGVPFCFQGGQEQGRSCLLKTKRAVTKGFLMCVQGYILKHILFNRNVKVKEKQRLLLTTAMNLDSLKCKLSVAARAQEESLAVALTDFLWKAGERRLAVVCLCGDSFNVNSSEHYQSDGCTERIQIFQFRKQEELYACIKTYLYEFFCEEGNGILLALYSLVLSRGFDNLTEDLEGDKDLTLVQISGNIHPCVANLMIAGRATKHLHNGIVFEGSTQRAAKMKTGILSRCEIGLLVGPSADGDDSEVGSRLKTPSLPLWVTRCNGHSYGIIFSPNRELIRNYHAEKTFDIYYYSCSGGQITPTFLTVDTREQPVREETGPPVLERVIRTKWHDAYIDWHGTTPYF
ncbi:inactive ubiquitin carboxyl-terminal hydrolase MINDY-4B-like [Macrobrachium nipponense]|uniref:inactive ubiquitin carboxyl-terminal hydrolase MINDY-4B-like n=1 Tax=Macrobrachium nipponense TaxID=159736 RepID=UPI0030C7E791